MMVRGAGFAAGIIAIPFAVLRPILPVRSRRNIYEAGSMPTQAHPSFFV
jgi:hypothetical protein